MSSSLSHFITAGLAGLPGPAMFPLGQGATGATRGSWKGEPRTAGVPSAPSCGQALFRQPSGLPALAWPPQLLFLPPQFYIVTKALYRIVLITFRC